MTEMLKCWTVARCIRQANDRGGATVLSAAPPYPGALEATRAGVRVEFKVHMKTIFRFTHSPTPVPVALLLLILSALAGSAASLAGSPYPNPEASPTPRLEDPASWVPKANGCLIEQTGSSIRIVGTNNISGWGNGNSVTTARALPAGDFYATVDFMVPQFSGQGSALVYLRAKSTADGGKMVGILCQPKSGTYQLQSWGMENTGNTFNRPPQPPRFGDEDKVFHRMKLKYDDAARTASGWVDEQFIGSIGFTFTDPVKFELLANTATKGMQIDLLFKDLYVSSSVSEAPPTPTNNLSVSRNISRALPAGTCNGSMPPNISAASPVSTNDVNLARQALIALFETRDSFLVPRLADDSNPPADLGAGVVQVGPARVNLQNRSWTLDWMTSASSMHYQGRFRVNERGEWTAQLSGFQEGLSLPRR